MAAPFTVDQKMGIDLNNTVLATDVAAGNARPACAIGTLVNATNGRTFVYAQAGGAIGSAVTVATVNPATFAATATGGAYTSPTTAMSTGDFGWFSKANV